MNKTHMIGPQTAAKNIIVRLPNWLGDAIMAVAALSALRRHFPHAALHVLCQANVAAVLQHNPDVDEILSYHKPSGWLHRLHHFEVIEMLQCGEYDLGILLTNSFSSAWWFWRGHVRYRLGYAMHWRSWLLNCALPLPAQIEKQHMVLTYKQLLAPLGIAPDEQPPKLFLSSEEQATAVAFLSHCNIKVGEDIVIGINPGAAYGRSKCWLPESFHALAVQLMRRDARVRLLFFGDASLKHLIDTICLGFSERVINLAGRTTLRELMALINLCQVVVSNDSGPMHVAAALKRPVVALFGSTNPTKTGPYSDNAIVLYKKVACSPCYRRVCPIDMRCMTQISVEEVMAAIQKLLASQQVRFSPA